MHQTLAQCIQLSAGVATELPQGGIDSLQLSAAPIRQAARQRARHAVPGAAADGQLPVRPSGLCSAASWHPAALALQTLDTFTAVWRYAQLCYCS